MKPVTTIKFIKNDIIVHSGIHSVLDTLNKNLRLDWTKKEGARSDIHLVVKKELRGKVPFSELDNLLKEIEQVEGQ